MKFHEPAASPTGPAQQRADEPMLRSGSRSRSRSGWRDTWWVRGATGGLVAVVVGVSIFVLWSSIATNRSVKQAIASSKLADHYATADAAVAVAELESLERKYRLEPSTKVRKRFDVATDKLAAALQRVREDGTAEDHALFDRIAQARQPYLASIGRMFDAADRLDQALALKIDEEEVDVRFEIIETAVITASDRHHADAIAIADLSALKARGSFNARATPAVFLLAMILVGWFASVLNRTRKQLVAQRSRAEHDALHHASTLLPNRSLLADRFRQACMPTSAAAATPACC